MEKIKVNVILADKIENNNIIGIWDTLHVQHLPDFWMYLTIKANLKPEDTIIIGFDIVKADSGNDDGWGVEIAEIKIGCRTEDVSAKCNREVMNDSKARTLRGLSLYKQIFGIEKKFPGAELELENGDYDFVVYLKESDGNTVLDTFHFIVEHD